jgi:hypothetical protein
MMHEVPMLADFGTRLALGLASLLLVTSWRDVPLPFFRTHCVVSLGLLVLAALDVSRGTGFGLAAGLLIAAALGAYLAAVTWGLGLPRLAYPLTGLVVLLTSTWLLLASRADAGWLWGFNTLSRYASALLMGSTLTAMLLGHHYLTAPAMSIDALKRFVGVMAGALVVRGLVAGAGLLLTGSFLPGSPLTSPESTSALFLLMRWGMGYAGPLVACVLAWKTVQIRSTQSATGILYVALALVLVGELSSLIAARSGGDLLMI